jgi:hypothetical protein
MQKKSKKRKDSGIRTYWAVDLKTWTLHRFYLTKFMMQWIIQSPTTRQWVTEDHWAYSAVAVARKNILAKKKVTFPIKLSRYMIAKGHQSLGIPI